MSFTLYDDIKRSTSRYGKYMRAKELKKFLKMKKPRRK